VFLPDLTLAFLKKYLEIGFKGFIPQEKGEGIALDGKTISGTGIHIVAAFTHKLQSVLFEVGADTKGKELVIGPEVLSNISLKEHIVTGDAMFAQRKICEQIVNGEGGYVFTVKGNQAYVEEAIKLYFADTPWRASIERQKMVTCWKAYARASGAINIL
jgi:predicted transposase YbfD/YdcC